MRRVDSSQAERMNAWATSCARRVSQLQAADVAEKLRGFHHRVGGEGGGGGGGASDGVMVDDRRGDRRGRVLREDGAGSGAPRAAVSSVSVRLFSAGTNHAARASTAASNLLARKCHAADMGAQRGP